MTRTDHGAVAASRHVRRYLDIGARADGGWSRRGLGESALARRDNLCVADNRLGNRSVGFGRSAQSANDAGAVVCTSDAGTRIAACGHGAERVDRCIFPARSTATRSCGSCFSGHGAGARLSTHDSRSSVVGIRRARPHPSARLLSNNDDAHFNLRTHGGGTSSNRNSKAIERQPGSMPRFLKAAAASGDVMNLTSARAASGCLPLAAMPLAKIVIFWMSAGSAPT